MKGSGVVRFAELDVDASGRRLSFDVLNLDLAVVNAIRRTILSDIPNVSMQFNPYDAQRNHVVISQNTSAIHNEMVGHRISMVPVCLTENEIAEVKSNPAKYRFEISERNATSQVINVTTKSIVVHENGVKATDQKREAIFPSDPITKDHVLLVKLRPSPLNNKDGEEIALQATLAMGSAKQHACFCPVSICYFTNKTDDAKAAAAFAEKVKAENESRSASKLAPLTPQEVDTMRREFDSLEKMRYFVTSDSGEPCHFTFNIDSECRMRPQYLVMKALMVLHDKVLILKAALEDAQDQSVSIAPFGNVPGLFQVSIMHEGHTMGNLLQSLLFNKYLRDAAPPGAEGAKSPIEFVGYHQPHPLEDYVFLKVKLATQEFESGNESRLRQLLENALKSVGDSMAALAVQWYSDAKVSALKVIELDNFFRTHEKDAQRVDLRQVSCKGAGVSKAAEVDTAGADLET